MKEIIIAVALLASTAKVDQSKYKTTFHVVEYSGSSYLSFDDDGSSPRFLGRLGDSLIGWSCIRTKIKSMPGIQQKMVGVVCSSTNDVYISEYAICDTDHAMRDTQSFAIGTHDPFINKELITLTVSCQTIKL